MRAFLLRQRQLATFLVVGVLSALIDVGLMQLLLMQGVAVVPATSAAFVLGLLFNITCHARYTFSAVITRGTVARYLCLIALNYGITLACVAAGTSLGAAPVVGKIVSLFIVPVNGFLLGKYWVFR